MIEVTIRILPSGGNPGHVAQTLAIWNVTTDPEAMECDYEYALSHQIQSPSLEDAPKAALLVTKTELVQVNGKVPGHNRVFESPARLVRKALNDAVRQLHAEDDPDQVG